MITMAVFMIALLFSCATFSASTAAAAGPTGPVSVALSGIENSYLILAENLAQSYLDTSNDIGQKLAEIKVATSTEAVSDIGALYSQYITAYAVLNQQAGLQMQAVQKLFGAASSSANFIYSPEEINVFTNAGQAISNSAEMAVNGIVTKMNAITNIISSPAFGISGDTMTMPIQEAEAYNQGLASFISANQGIAGACVDILALNQTSMVARQSNKYAAYFVNALFNHYQHNLASYNQIISILQSTSNAFGSPLTSSSSTYTASYSNMIAVAVSQGSSLETAYEILYGIQQAFQREITNQSGLMS